jgi:hypothetical protein
VREKKKILYYYCTIDKLNQQQPAAEKKKILFCILMSKTLKELTRVQREGKKSSTAG